MTFTYLFLLGLATSLVTRYYLASRQIRHVWTHRPTVPADFADRISLPEHQKAADYTIAKLRLGLFEVALSAAILVGFTLLGGLQALQEFTLRYLEPGVWQQITLLLCKAYRDWETDRKSTRLNSSHSRASRMPSSA